MKKITIKHLSPAAQEIIVTGKIGDLSVRQYVKKHNLVDEIVKMRLSDFTDDEVIEVLADSLDGLDVDTATKRAKEILAVTREDVANQVAYENMKADEWGEEHAFLKSQSQKGVA